MLLSIEKWVTSTRPITMQPKTPGIGVEPLCHRLVREECGWFVEPPVLLCGTQVLTNAEPVSTTGWQTQVQESVLCSVGFLTLTFPG